MPAHFNVMQLNIDLIAHRWVLHLCKKAYGLAATLRGALTCIFGLQGTGYLALWPALPMTPDPAQDHASLSSSMKLHTAYLRCFMRAAVPWAVDRS